MSSRRHSPGCRRSPCSAGQPRSPGSLRPAASARKAGTGSCAGRAATTTAPWFGPASAPTSSSTAGRERERLVGLRAAERHEVLGTRLPEQDVAVRHGAHGDVRDERASVRRGNGDRDRVRPRERRTALGMRQAPRRRRRDDRDEARVGETPSPRAEHARRKARLRDRRARARSGGSATMPSQTAASVT